MKSDQAKLRGKLIDERRKALYALKKAIMYGNYCEEFDDTSKMTEFLEEARNIYVEIKGEDVYGNTDENINIVKAIGPNPILDDIPYKEVKDEERR